MNGRCTFGFIYMNCSSGGPASWVLFGIFGICVVLSMVFGIMIDNRLYKEHPAERGEVRLDLIGLYQRYAWKQRGRVLGDDKLTLLLDRFRIIQVTAFASFALMCAALYVGI